MVRFRTAKRFVMGKLFIHRPGHAGCDEKRSAVRGNPIPPRSRRCEASESTDSFIESAFIRIFMHCCVKSLAIRVTPFLALHENSRMKADNDFISASLGEFQNVTGKPGRRNPWGSWVRRTALWIKSTVSWEKGTMYTAFPGCGLVSYTRIREMREVFLWTGKF